MQPTIEQLQTIEARIADVKSEIPQKAATDPEFREALLANPQAAIEKFYGLPEGLLKKIPIQIFEEAPGSIGLVIPPSAKSLEEELTEEQLEAVAGGAGFGGLAVGVVTIAFGSMLAVLALDDDKVIDDIERGVSGWGR